MVMGKFIQRGADSLQTVRFGFGLFMWLLSLFVGFIGGLFRRSTPEHTNPYWAKEGDSENIRALKY